jgi:hypothetical protein
MAEFESFDGEDDWSDEFANDLIGSTLLVGITYVDHDDQLIRREQVYGTVMSADQSSGIVIQQDAGEDFVIAPVLNAIEYAQPGIYQLADEDAAVENPDFTALLIVRSPLRS